MDELVYAGNKALQLALALSMPPVIVATVVGLLIGLFQTVTQIQEQTLPFGIKLVSVILCIYLLSGWFGEHLLNYAVEMMNIATKPAH
ncbi:MAG: type secretion system protein SpaQ [Solimicrobium sp.]|jgi:type III secretion protein S|nr:type secretion system protein SpaQ [Solimicrobium sp.]